MAVRRTGITALVAALIFAIPTIASTTGPAGASAAPNEHRPEPAWLISPMPGIRADRTTGSGADTPEPVRIDPRVLDRRSPRRVRTALNGRITDLDLAPVESGTEDSRTWSGRVVGDDLSSVTIIERDGATHGVVWSRDGDHRIHADADGIGIVQELRTDLPQGADDAISPPAPMLLPSAPARGRDGGPPDPIADPDGPIVRILIVFTPQATIAARAAAPGRDADDARRDFAILLVDSTNTIYADSGVRGRMELAGVTTVERDLGLDEKDLEAVTLGPAGRTIRATRDQLEADLVAVVTGDDHPRYCGLAWLMETLDVEAMAPFGYSMTRFDCALDSLTFAHETGHNMGLGHDRHTAMIPALPFPYGYGWSNAAESWFTIQAYTDHCRANSPAPSNCRRIPRYSTPNRTWTTGSPLGTPWPGPNSADAVRALDGTQPIVASYRGPRHVSTPTGPCGPESDWPCPFTSWERFVDQQWRDFGHTGSTTDRNTVAARLRNREQSPEAVISDLMASTASSRIRSRVVRLYLAYFLRSPDLGGFDFWVDRYRSSPNIVRIAAHFAKSGEFRNRYGTLDNGAFVDLVYANVLGRAPDPEGRRYWKSQLDRRRMTRGRVMVGFSDAREFGIRRAAEIDTILAHRAMLATVPTTARYDEIVAGIEAGSLTIEDLIVELSRTPAYAERIRP